MASVTVRIAGANGDGLESSGALLIKVANRSGLYVFGYRSYQSVVRGGHVWNQIRLSTSALQSYGDGIDVLVALNQDAITNHMGRLNKNAVVIFDPSKASANLLDASRFRLVQLPMLEIAAGLGGSPVMKNMAAIGAVLGFLGIDMGVVNSVITDAFSDKGQEVVDKNIKIAMAGYSYDGVGKAYDLKGDGKARYVIDGNSAIAMGAFAAGCKFYAAYPMTPATADTPLVCGPPEGRRTLQAD